MLAREVTHFVETVVFPDVADGGLATEVIRLLLGAQVQLLGLDQIEERGLHACGKVQSIHMLHKVNLPFPFQHQSTHPSLNTVMYSGKLSG